MALSKVLHSSESVEHLLLCCRLEARRWKHCRSPAFFFLHTGYRISFDTKYRAGLNKDAKSVQLGIFAPDSCLGRASTSHKTNSTTLHCIRRRIFSGEGPCCYCERNNTLLKEEYRLVLVHGEKSRATRGTENTFWTASMLPNNWM